MEFEMESEKPRGKGESFSPQLPGKDSSSLSLYPPWLLLPAWSLHPPLPLLPPQTEATCQDQTEADSEQAGDSRKTNEHPTSGQKLRGVLRSHQIHPPASESCYHVVSNSSPNKPNQTEVLEGKKRMAGPFSFPLFPTVLAAV